MSAIDVCNRCHDLLMMSMNLSDIAILNRWIISEISKNVTINLTGNADLNGKKTKTYETWKCYYHI